MHASLLNDQGGTTNRQPYFQKTNTNYGVPNDTQTSYNSFAVPDKTPENETNYLGMAKAMKDQKHERVNNGGSLIKEENQLKSDTNHLSKDALLSLYSSDLQQ